MRYFFIVIIFLTGCAGSSEQAKQDTVKTVSIPITIKWVNDLPGDFSFSKNWSYPWGAEKKGDGSVGCADGGFCPERCQKMLNKYGKIPKDSVKIFYQLLDTTHLFHSIECEAECYEWAGTDFMEVYRTSKDSFYCHTMCDIATHCSLKLEIVKDTCYAIIDLKSVAPDGDATYYCTSGFITIDKKSWEKGIMKAEFSFNFKPKNPKDPIYWKGKIYSEIKMQQF